MSQKGSLPAKPDGLTTLSKQADPRHSHRLLGAPVAFIKLQPATGWVRINDRWSVAGPSDGSLKTQERAGSELHVGGFGVPIEESECS